MGARLVYEVANKTNDDAGDGTTTAALLAQSVIHKGMANVEKALTRFYSVKVSKKLPRKLRKGYLKDHAKSKPMPISQVSRQFLPEAPKSVRLLRKQWIK